MLEGFYVSGVISSDVDDIMSSSIAMVRPGAPAPGFPDLIPPKK